MKIHAIEFARSSLPESMVLAGGAADRHLKITFLLYVIEMADRKILIDAGCDDLPGFDMRDFIRPDDALRNYGIAPETITDVIITHAHHDHIDGLRHFPKVRVYIQATEFAKGLSYIPDDAVVITFRDRYKLADGITIQCIGGHTAGSSIVLVKNGDKQYIFGGDEIYHPICLKTNIPTGTSHNPKNSADFLQIVRNCNAQLLLTHDPNISSGIII